MRLGIFADIHGNLEALQAFVQDAAQRNIHRYMCLGDLVGYGPNPNECIELIRTLPKLNCVLGNHDAAAFWRFSPYAMNEEAKQSILWTIEQLTEQNSAFLQSLQPTCIMGNICFAHANPYNPEAYRYVLTRKYAVRSFTSVREQLTFIGHSHRPLVITRKNLFQIIFTTPQPEESAHLSQQQKQIINCGSIGQPRDGDPRAGYCILDTRDRRVEFHRVVYDHQKTSDKIRRAGLPEFLGKRLAMGK